MYIPKKYGGTKQSNNLVAACYACCALCKKDLDTRHISLAMVRKFVNLERKRQRLPYNKEFVDANVDVVQEPMPARLPTINNNIVGPDDIVANNKMISHSPPPLPDNLTIDEDVAEHDRQMQLILDQIEREERERNEEASRLAGKPPLSTLPQVLYLNSIIYQFSSIVGCEASV
jgi:hypothetical protein